MTDRTLPPLPAESFPDALTHLRRPFTPAAMRWKVQVHWGPNGQLPQRGLIVGYIDARLAIERLNLVAPDWEDSDYTPVDGGLLRCKLTVLGTTRQDVGQGAGKGQWSDAFKRAAVKFGVGVSCYALPKIVLDARDGHVEPKGTLQKPRLEITASGSEHLRAVYGLWLDTDAGRSFGPPLDHGDAEGAVGDPLDPDAEHELDEAAQPRELPEAPPAKEAPDRAVPRITEGQAKLVEIRAAQAGMAAHELLDLCVRHGAGSAGGLTPDGFRTVLAEIEARADVQESVAP